MVRLQFLEKALGVDPILGGASSHNRVSHEFMRQNSFSECGKFQRVGHKFDQDLDIIWMQKFI